MSKSVSLPLVLFDVQPIAFPVQKVSLEMKVYKSRQFTQHFQNVDLQSFLITTCPSTNRFFWINRLALLLTSCGLSWWTATSSKSKSFPHSITTTTTTTNHHHIILFSPLPVFLLIPWLNITDVQRMSNVNCLIMKNTLSSLSPVSPVCGCKFSEIS